MPGLKTRTVLVPVTADDLREGDANDDIRCPVALALRRIVKPGVMFSVGRDSIRVSVPPRIWAVGCKLPPEAQRFIARVDAAAAPRPRAIAMEIPCAALPRQR